MKKKTTSFVLLLLLASGCGQHAAADWASTGNETVMPARQPVPPTKESDPYREECKWKRQLFC